MIGKISSLPANISKIRMIFDQNAEIMVIASRSDAIQARSDIVKAGNDRCHGCCQTLTIQTNHKETDDGDHHIGDQISVQITCTFSLTT